MAGSRLEKFGSIYKRARGLLRSGVISERNQPIWFEVMKAFPPKVEPTFERPEPEGTVCKILYPEDVVRARFYEKYTVPEVVTMDFTKFGSKTKAQMFIESYLERQDKNLTEEEVFHLVEREMKEKGITFVSKEAYNKKSQLKKPELEQEFTVTDSGE